MRPTLQRLARFFDLCWAFGARSRLGYAFPTPRWNHFPNGLVPPGFVQSFHDALRSNDHDGDDDCTLNDEAYADVFSKILLEKHSYGRTHKRTF